MIRSFHVIALFSPMYLFLVRRNPPCHSPVLIHRVNPLSLSTVAINVQRTSPHIAPESTL
jgi:hypothetical protein